MQGKKQLGYSCKTLSKDKGLCQKAVTTSSKEPGGAHQPVSRLSIYTGQANLACTLLTFAPAEGVNQRPKDLNHTKKNHQRRCNIQRKNP